MKKTLFITIGFSLLLIASPLSLAKTSSSAMDNSTFYYQPMAVWSQANTATVSPNGIPS